MEKVAGTHLARSRSAVAAAAWRTPSSAPRLSLPGCVPVSPPGSTLATETGGVLSGTASSPSVPLCRPVGGCCWLLLVTSCHHSGKSLAVVVSLAVLDLQRSCSC